MLTKMDLINSRKKATKRPDESELRRLPYKNGYIYGRVSSPGQVRDSKESIREIARLVTLAKDDGIITGLDEKQVEDWRRSTVPGIVLKES